MSLKIPGQPRINDPPPTADLKLFLERAGMYPPKKSRADHTHPVHFKTPSLPQPEKIFSHMAAETLGKGHDGATGGASPSVTAVTFISPILTVIISRF